MSVRPSTTLTTRGPRGAVVLSALALTGSLVALAPSAQAQADPSITNGSAGSQSSAYNQGNCSLSDTSGNASDQGEFTGARTTRSSSYAGTFTNNNDDADTSRFSVSSTATQEATVTSGSLSSYDLTGSTTTQVTRAQGESDCAVVPTGQAGSNFEFVLTQPGYISMTATNRGAGDTFAYVASSEQGQVSEKFLYLLASGTESDSGVSSYLPAGRYQLNTVTGNNVFNRGREGDQVNGTSTSAVHAVFRPAGTATTKARGAAKSRVTTPDARSCDTDSITVQLADVTNVKSARFFVNGKKLATVKQPRSATSVKLDAVDGKPLNFKAVVRIDGKKVKHAKTLRVTRSYLSCNPS